MGTSWIVFLVLVMLVGTQPTQACPSDCSCKWKGGKQWVECVSKNLRTFPPTIDAGTQVLDMSGNSFETLPPDHFMRSGLINLQKIFLSKCRLSHINSRAFRGLSNLVELDLGSNLLRDVPSSAFADTTGLMRLVLSGNPIPVLAKRAFVALEALTTLELSSTGLELIEHGAFEGLHSIEWLKLDGNRLKSVKGLNVLPLGLKGLSLEDNPWECDCHLVELRLWLSDRNVANSAEPRCNGPDRLQNSTIKSLPPDAFACFPQLSPTTMFQKIGEGKNVSLLCKVLSVPESSLEWLFNGQPLTNSSLNLLVETTSAYPSGGLSTSSHLLSSSSSSSSISSLATPVEKKSELLILNATSDENGTFLCLARNPAGSALANFTLRVLNKYDGNELTGGGDYSSLSGFGQLPQLVSNYPNLFIIALSTIAVIGLLLVLFFISFILCKCSAFCCGRRGSHSNSSSSSKLTKCEQNMGIGSIGGKLDRDRNGLLNLSDASTLTTNTKTNGSVFLLSSSSQGDSNPDLIEGVAMNASTKRGDGDGLDSVIYNSHHHVEASPSSHQNLYYSSNTSINSQGLTQPTLLLHVPSNNRLTFSSNSPSFEGSMSIRQWPVDFGLPYSSTTPTTTVPLPAGYDLSKYPKEYFSPQQQGHHSYEYTVANAAVLYSDYPTLGYHHPHPPPHHHQLLYPNSCSSRDEYNNQSNPNCSCGPILEGNETEDVDGPEEGRGMMATRGIMGESCLTKTASTSPLRSSSERLSLAKSSGTKNATAGGKVVVGTNSKTTTTTGTCTGASGASVVAAAQQIINESPDEGYEDGGAEGTEI